MVQIETRLFGKIAVEDDKIIRFNKGILGFPELKDFTLIYDIYKGSDASIKWLQSIQEPGFAMPVMDPELVIHDYRPEFEADKLKPLGDSISSENILLLVTVTVPKDITQITVNLKAPIIISADNCRAVQLISDNEEHKVKYPIYDKLSAEKVARE